MCTFISKKKTALAVFLYTITMKIQPLIVNSPIKIDPQYDTYICMSNNYDNLLDVQKQCIEFNKTFIFYATDATFKMDGVTYAIPKNIQKQQAFKANIDYFPVIDALNHSKFRSRFKLEQSDISYIRKKGWETIESHTQDFIETRLSTPTKDGKQTPMKGHPVFIAQHATATCCRGCLEKWHHIPKGRPLTEKEQIYVQRLILRWIQKKAGIPA